MDKLEVHILLQSIGFDDLMYVLCDFEDVAIRYIKHYVRFFGRRGLWIKDGHSLLTVESPRMIHELSPGFPRD